MSQSYYDMTVPVLKTSLSAMREILLKAQAYCAEHSIEESALLQFRLFPDMHGLARQVQIGCDAAKNAAYRLVGEEPPSIEDNEQSFDELLARIDQTLDWLGALEPDQFDGREHLPISIGGGPGMKITFPNASVYLHNFVMPNFYFHYSTVYNMLRHNGLAIGKLDFIGQVDAEMSAI